MRRIYNSVYCSFKRIEMANKSRCDLITTLELLSTFHNGSKNLYQTNKTRGWSLSKTHRYIQYCLKRNLLELEKEEETGRGLGKTKYYRLTTEGRNILSASKGLKKEKLARPKKIEKKNKIIYLKS